jgi:xanthosine utilization system XapX-like protein
MKTRRAANGALAGVAAAAVWAAQQPLDQRVFRCSFDDVELLGRWVTRGKRWRGVGLVLHLQNGAGFGALYGLVQHRLPGPPPVRGAAVAMVEHLATWPLVRVVDRVHPARRKLPTLAGSRRALAQATWRHLVFGLVLGAVEARLNPPQAAAVGVSPASA